MEKMKSIMDQVLLLLIEDKRLRSDDMLLYLRFCERYQPDYPIGHLPFHFVMENYRQLGLPCFSSVRRARQKAQQKYPELAPVLREHDCMTPVCNILCGLKFEAKEDTHAKPETE